MCSIVSDMNRFLQAGRRQNPPLFSDQKRHNLSVRYRPVRKSPWIFAALAWYGFPSREVNIGWGLVSDRCEGCRYSSDGNREASEESLECQKSWTFSLHSFLKAGFGGGTSRRVRGWGSLYCRQISRISWNQEHCYSGLLIFTFEPYFIKANM